MQPDPGVSVWWQSIDDGRKIKIVGTHGLMSLWIERDVPGMGSGVRGLISRSLLQDLYVPCKEKD